jgi:hypothetical protein
MPIDLRGTGCARRLRSVAVERDSRMAFKVQVGAAQIAIHQGQSVLLTEPGGQVNSPSNRGLFHDTRVISAWAIYTNGEPWDLLNGGAIAPHAAPIFRTNRAFVSEDGPIAARTLGLVIGRHTRADCTRILTSPITASVLILSFVRFRFGLRRFRAI